MALGRCQKRGAHQPSAPRPYMMLAASHALVCAAATFGSGSSQYTLGPLGLGQDAWPGTNGKHFFVTFPNESDKYSTLSPELLEHYPEGHDCRKTVFAKWNGTDPVASRVSSSSHLGCALETMLIGYDSETGLLCAAAAGVVVLERAHSVFLMISRGVMQATSGPSLGSFGPLTIRLGDNPDDYEMCPANLGFFRQDGPPCPTLLCHAIPGFRLSAEP
eukprot:645315-Prymnesium_polylepis.1